MAVNLNAHLRDGDTAFARAKWRPLYLGACPPYPGLWDGGLGRWVEMKRMKFLGTQRGG